MTRIVFSHSYSLPSWSAGEAVRERLALCWLQEGAFPSEREHLVFESRLAALRPLGRGSGITFAERFALELWAPALHRVPSVPRDRIGTALRCFAGTMGWVLVLYLVMVSAARRVRAVGATCRPCGETR